MSCFLDAARPPHVTKLMLGMIAISAPLDGLVNEAAWINEAKVSVDPAEVNAKVRVLYCYS